MIIRLSSNSWENSALLKCDAPWGDWFYATETIFEILQDLVVPVPFATVLELDSTTQDAPLRKHD